MRIARLDLIAFGCFAGQRIDFDQNPGALQLVYGPNEAGKSTCLRAIGHWLFGFPHAKQDDFRHPANQLRIGGVLEKANGQSLEYIRRRGSKAALRGSNDRDVINPEKLAEFLGGIDFNTFKSLFGIDHEELRTGGDNISKSEGQLSQILFAAGSGLGSLRKIQEELNAECDALFTPTAKNRTINELLTKIKAVSKQAKESSLSTEHWNRRNAELLEKRRLGVETSQQIQSLKLSIAKLERIKQGIPLSSKIKLLNEQLVPLASATILPDDFMERRVTAETKLKAAALVAETASSDIERARKELSEIALPETLLDQSAAIKELQIKLGAFRKGEIDRPRIEAEIHTARNLAQEILKKVGLRTNFEQHDQPDVDQWQRGTIERLSEDFQELSSKQRALASEIGRLQEEIAALPKDEVSNVDSEQLADLKQAVVRAQPLRDLAKNRQKLLNEKKQIESEAELELQRLPLFQGSLSELEKLKFPLPETVEKFAADLIELEQKLKVATSHLQDSEKRLRQAQRSLERLRRDHSVPSQSDLEQARKNRDAVVQLAIQTIRGEAPADSPAVQNSLTGLGASNDLPTALLGTIEQTDQIADQLRKDADKVAQLTKTEADLEERMEDHTERERILAEIVASIEEFDQRWSKEWGLPNAKPLSPVEMRSWLVTRSGLLQKSANCRALNAEIERMNAQEQSGIADILSRLQALKVSSDSSQADLSQLLDFVERKNLELEQMIQSSKDRQNKLAHLERDLSRKQKDLAQVESQLVNWQSLWESALKPLRLPPERSPKEVKLFLQALDDVTTRSHEVADKQKRVDGLLRDKLEYEKEVLRIAESVGLTTSAPTETIAEELNERLDAAKKALTQQESLRESLRKSESAFDHANAEIKNCTNELSELCKIAKCTEPSELPECERLSRDRLEFTRERDQFEQSLAEIAGEIDRDDFLAALVDSDLDEVTLEIEKKKSEQSELTKSLEIINQDIGRVQKDVDEMSGQATALEAKIEGEQLRARLRREVDEYIRFRLALAILHQGMERYRERNQGPALARASEIFSQLTKSAFAAIHTDFDETGKGQLLAIRVDDNTGLPASALSTGTRDQMYLAIRLALLEHQFLDRQPMPLILDDILIHFDDQRSRAALRVLADLAQKNQVILFTHHRHLIELAQQSLAKNQFSLHELQP